MKNKCVSIFRNTLYTSSFVLTYIFYKVFGKLIQSCVRIGLDWIQLGLDWIRISGLWIWTGLDPFNSIHFILIDDDSIDKILTRAQFGGGGGV